MKGGGGGLACILVLCYAGVAWRQRQHGSWQSICSRRVAAGICRHVRWLQQHYT
jgi:hypothetical protein